MSRNSELIQRVQRISLELPILKGEFDKAVDVAKSAKDVEPAFNAMSDYRNALADELVGRGPACTKLAIALRGGFDVPEPYAFIFDAIVELESAKEPIYDPFELHHDRMAKPKVKIRAIAQAWFDQLSPSERKQVLAEHTNEYDAIEYFKKKFENLRAKRNRERKSKQK